jgi:hypothetical protein
MLYDRGLATAEDKKGIGQATHSGCIDRAVCKKCHHLIVDSICLCSGYFVCPNCGHENGRGVMDHIASIERGSATMGFYFDTNTLFSKNDNIEYYI